MITGAHVIIYSKDAAADRAFLKDVIGLSSIDVGGGWLIFALPPAEVAVHPSPENDGEGLYLMCDDVAAFKAEMAGKAVDSAPVQETDWGKITQVRLPGGGKLVVYQPKHERPPAK